MATTEEVRLTLTAEQFNRGVDAAQAKFQGFGSTATASMGQLQRQIGMIGRLMGGLGTLHVFTQFSAMAERLNAAVDQALAAADARQLQALGGGVKGEAAGLFRQARGAEPAGPLALSGRALGSVGLDFLGSLASLFSSAQADRLFRSADELWASFQEGVNATDTLAEGLRTAAEQRAGFEARTGQQNVGLENEVLALGGPDLVHQLRRQRASMEDAVAEAGLLRDTIRKLREELMKTVQDGHGGGPPIILGPGQ